MTTLIAVLKHSHTSPGIAAPSQESKTIAYMTVFTLKQNFPFLGTSIWPQSVFCLCVPGKQRYLSGLSCLPYTDIDHSKQLEKEIRLDSTWRLFLQNSQPTSQLWMLLLTYNSSSYFSRSNCSFCSFFLPTPSPDQCKYVRRKWAQT